jgi:hypothetical protein
LLICKRKIAIILKEHVDDIQIAKNMMNAPKQKGKKIEPHVILHLRINQEDIDRYMKSKIQTDPSDMVQNVVAPQPYDADNVSLFTDAFGNEPTPANLDDPQFETLSITESEFDELKKSNVFPNDNSLLMQTNITGCNETSIGIASSPNNIMLKVESPKRSLEETTDEKKEIVSLSNYNLENVPHINLDKTPNIPQPKVTEDIECSDTKIKLIAAMGEFADANRRNEWTKSTAIWCGWCSHPFTGPPVSIPKWHIKKTFFVSGCYCSYSCASKHLFSRGDVNESNKWNYYNLLHLLRKKILGVDDTMRIPLAPPRETLQVFGGHLSIDDFRNATSETHNHHKIYNILEPPMVSIIPCVEETTYLKSKTSDMRLLNTPGGMRAYGNMKYVAPKNESYYSSTRWGKNKPYIPVDKERMKRAVENLKVKRKAPLLDKKKTLLHYMNLKINNKKKEIKDIRIIS